MSCTSSLAQISSRELSGAAQVPVPQPVASAGMDWWVSCAVGSSIPAKKMIAKTAYPEKFKDVNPLEIYKKMRVEFFKKKGEDFKMAYPAGE